MRIGQIGTVSIGIVAVLAACGASPEDVRELREGQRKILAKLDELQKSLEQGGRPPAAAPTRPDPSKVYSIPAGDSPSKGPAEAPVLLAEFADFQ